MALGSLVDKPLIQNPLAGGGFGGALEAPAPTYDELQGDALVKQISMRMMQQDVKSPAFNAFASEVMKTKGYPTKTIQEYNTLFPNNLLTQNPLLGATMPSQEEGMPGASGSNIPLDPQADMPAVLGPKLLGAFNPAEQYEGDDPLVKGYLGSDFYERMSTTNVVPYTYQGKEMSGSGSYASNFKKYLESIGKGDLIQFPDQEIAQQGSGSLTTIGGSTPPPGSGTPMDPIGVGQDIFGNNPAEIAVPSTPNPIQGVGFDGKPMQNGKSGIENLQNPYQNNNNNMSNFKNMEKLLQNIDGGIQSLIDNSSYMQNNNNLSQFPFSNSSSPNFMGGDILKWSSYK